jgi:hypothetical protein
VSGVRVPPAFRSGPVAVRTASDVVVEFGELIGRSYDAEQRLVIETVTGLDRWGRWSAMEGCVVCPRQNLKTFVLEGIALAKLFVLGSELIVWSAHLFSTAMESLRSCERLIGGCGEVSRYVRRVSHANGAEGIELVDGRRMLFRARSKDGGRGLSGDDVVLDEAFALLPSHLGALLPTLSARPNPQVLYGSSAPKADSVILHQVMARGRSGTDPGLAYVEWSAPQGGCRRGGECSHTVSEPGCALDDRGRWQAANPAMGRRIRAATIATERRSLPPTEFARERLGWPQSPVEAAAGPITLALWQDLADPSSSRPRGRPVWGVDVSPQRTAASIGVAAWREADAEGPAHLGLVDHRSGTGWVVDRLAAAAERAGAWEVWVDPASPAVTMVEDLQGAGLVVQQVTSRELGAACGRLQDDVTRRPAVLVHVGDPILTAAVGAARRRDIGDGGWAWARKRSDGDITALVAVTLAYHGLVGGAQASDVY